MRRLLAPLPATYSLLQLRQAAVARFPTFIDFNVVDVDGTAHAAVYLPDGNTTDPAAWQGSVAAHVPVSPTPEEQATTADTNRATLTTQALTALANNRTYVALTNPTTAQSTAQIKALTRQINGVIRLLLQQLDGTD